MTVQAIPELFDLSGKVAVVTGGTKGTGQSIAFRLAEAGAGVIITGRDSEAAGYTLKQIKAEGGKAEAILADAANTADAKRVVGASIEAFGRLDILVNNAGVFPTSPFNHITEESWDHVLDTNLKGMFFYSQIAAQEMIKAGHKGKIINIASLDGLRPSGQLVHYDASKGGVIMLTKALALELAPHGILVNAIAPYGITTTPGGMRMQEAALASSGRTIEEAGARRLARFPLGRTGEPDDVAKAVLFLASAAADYITGILLVVDGGNLLT